jgi:hypothetical protein
VEKVPGNLQPLSKHVFFGFASHPLPSVA